MDLERILLDFAKSNIKITPKFPIIIYIIFLTNNGIGLWICVGMAIGDGRD